jgi:hypothetical protein
LNLEFALETPNFAEVDQRTRWWPMRPSTGSILADIFWFSLLFTIHQHILPSILGPNFPIDLVTPWLVISFVVSSPSHSLLLWLVASSLMETSTIVPRGFYLCAYWLIFAAILLTRRTLSWKLTVPWVVSFFFASFCLGNFETLLIFLKQDGKQLGFNYFFFQAIKTLLAIVIGMTYAQTWMIRFKGDLTPRASKEKANP